MNTPTHTFPLPEAETTKLEIVTDELRHETPRSKITDCVQTNPWHCVLIVALFGVLFGLWSLSRN
jgi:ElaB/YqjD/DUF883 family membrane-anchored ribosome-binding protein